MCTEIIHYNLYHLCINFLYQWACWIHRIATCTTITVIIHAQCKLIIRLHWLSLVTQILNTFSHRCRADTPEEEQIDGIVQ